MTEAAPAAPGPVRSRRALTPRRVAAVAIFLGVVFGGDRLIALALDRLTLASEIRFSRLYRGGMHNDVLIFGHSRGVNGFYAPDLDERIGGAWINLSHNATPFRIEEALFLDYLERNAPPRAIILEVTSVTFGMDALTLLKPYWRHSPRLRALAAEYARDELNGSRVSHLYGFNTEGWLRAMYYLQRTDQDWINRYSMTAAFYQKVVQDPPEDLNEPVPADVAALQRMAAAARQRGIAVRCVITPFLPVYLNKMRDFAGWKARVQQQLGPDVKIWDYSGAVTDPEGFADRVHLNHRGWRLFLERLIADGFFDGMVAPRRS